MHKPKKDYMRGVIAAKYSEVHEPTPSNHIWCGDKAINDYYERIDSVANKYKDPRWIRKRNQALRRDGYLCQQCKRYGRTRAADTVHHVNPVDVSPNLWLALWNLLSLCRACHDAMHDRVTGNLTSKGEEWAKRTSPPSK